MSAPPRVIRPRRWASGVLPAVLAVSLGTSVAAFGGVHVPAWALALEGAAILFVIALGVAWQGSGIFARPVLAVRTERPELALTFDDGPHPLFTPPILEALESRGHRGTFFVIGQQAESHPELLTEIARRGHALGNHSYAHSYLTNTAAPVDLAEGLRRTDALIHEATGAQSRWFRAPVGLLSPRIAAACRLAKMDLVAWTASARDGVEGRSVEDAVRRLEPQLRPGAILVLHDGAMGSKRRSIALPVLTEILGRLEAKGLRSVTLDALMAPSMDR